MCSKFRTLVELYLEYLSYENDRIRQRMMERTLQRAESHFSDADCGRAWRLAKRLAEPK